MEARYSKMELVRDFARAALVSITGAKSSNMELIKKYEIQFQNDAVWITEGRSVYNALIAMLTEDLKNESKLTDDSLNQYVQFLQKRIKQIKDTNQMYTVVQHSEVNLACIELAKMLHSANPNSKTHKHYYDYLFADLPCTTYKSSRGPFQALSLSEFYIGENGVPIEFMATLEAFEQAVFNPSPFEPRRNPPHTCLPVKEGTPVPALSVLEHTYLTSNPLTDALYKAILKKDKAQINQIKQDLAAVIARPGFDFGWRYKDSEKQLLRNGFITVSPGAKDLRSLATVFSQMINPADWKRVITAFDKEQLYQICLPTHDGKAPILRVIEEDQLFQEFINCDEFYNCEDLWHVRAAKFIILELYIRVRLNQPAQISTIGQISGGRIGNSIDAKLITAQHLQGFYQQEKLPLNRHDLHFAEIKATEAVANGLSDGRLAMALEHDKKIWNKVLTLANANSPSILSLMSGSAGNVVLFPQPATPSLIYTENDLKMDAFKLTRIPVTEWKAHIEANLNEIGLRGLISDDNFIPFVNRPDLYLEDNENHNRAIIAILCTFYRRNRSEDHNITGVGRFLGAAGSYVASDKQSKLNLCDIFLGYIYSGKALNKEKFEEYLRLNNLSQYQSSLEEKGYFGRESTSKLGTLVALVFKLGNRELFHPKPKGWY